MFSQSLSSPYEARESPPAGGPGGRRARSKYLADMGDPPGWMNSPSTSGEAFPYSMVT